MNVAAGQESEVIWTGTPLEEIYNGVESLRYARHTEEADKLKLVYEDNGIGISDDTGQNLF